MSTKESASEVVGSDTSLSVSGLTESVDISGISGLVDDTTNLSSEDLLSSNDTTGKECSSFVYCQQHNVKFHYSCIYFCCMF